MEHRPTSLLPWVCEHFAEDGEKTPDYEKAARDLQDKTGYHVEAETLRHVARGYKRPSGVLAAAVQSWTVSAVLAVDLLTWPHYARQPEGSN
jgi:hypothetical protein